jgi:hypothetical protein
LAIEKFLMPKGIPTIVRQSSAPSRTCSMASHSPPMTIHTMLRTPFENRWPSFSWRVRPNGHMT